MRLKSMFYMFASPGVPNTTSFPHPIQGLNRAPGPIACSTFNSTGTLFVYAVSYNWYKGFTGMTAGHPNKLIVHLVKDEEVRKRAPRK